MTTHDMILALRAGLPLRARMTAEIAGRLDDLYQYWIDHELAYLASASVVDASGRCGLIAADPAVIQAAARLVAEGVIGVDAADLTWSRRHAA